MPYARFLQVARVAIEQHEQETRQRMREAAFIGWQNYILQPLKKGKRHMNLKNWIKQFGLDEQVQFKPITKEERAELLAKSREQAKKIVRLHNRQQKEKA